ncbi:MAG TPA: Rrf2 family transcriptional regulator [Acidobacteriota bacterium]|nr:Rrf2 family transcriptional regulator [Acidobacteriota bacterium]
MEVTRGTLYAVYVLIYFHLRPKGEMADLTLLSDTLDIPNSYLSKVLQQLHKGGYITSQMGSKGGYRLARDVEKTTMKEVMHIIQGDPHLQECLIEDFRCDRFKKCSVIKHVRNVQEVVNNMLDQLTIGQLALEMQFKEQQQQKVLGQVSLGVQ